MTPRSATTTAILSLLGLLAGCGKVGPPQPPLRLQPQRPGNVALSQQGATVHLGFTAPSASVDDLRLPVLDMTIAWTSEKGVDLAKKGERIKLQAAPGEQMTQVLSPTPAVGTTVRATVTATAKHRTSQVGGPVSLVVAKPPAPPEDVVAVLGRTGVQVSWKPLVFAPTPTPAPSQAPASAAPPPPAAPGPPRRPPAASAPPQAGSVPSSPPTATPTPPPSAAAGAGPSTAHGTPRLPVGINVYAREVGTETWERVTSSPVAADSFFHANGAERPECYVARVVLRVNPVIESEPSAEACVEARSTLPLEAITGLRAVAIGDEVALSWSPPADTRSVAVRVYRSQEGGSPTLLTEVKVPATTARDPHPPRDVLLSYRLVPVDAQGHEGPASEPDTVRMRDEP
jgi:hypothetical protein